jgi:hypothetical protein
VQVDFHQQLREAEGAETSLQFEFTKTGKLEIRSGEGQMSFRFSSFPVFPQLALPPATSTPIRRDARLAMNPSFG